MVDPVFNLLFVNFAWLFPNGEIFDSDDPNRNPESPLTKLQPRAQGGQSQDKISLVGLLVAKDLIVLYISKKLCAKDTGLA